jgi:hypothetical protein
MPAHREALNLPLLILSMKMMFETIMIVIFCFNFHQSDFLVTLSAGNYRIYSVMNLSKVNGLHPKPSISRNPQCQDLVSRDGKNSLNIDTHIFKLKQ